MNIFMTLFAIQQHSWTALEWIRQTLMRLYNQLSVRKRENSSLFLTPVGQTKGKMAENRLPAAPTSGVFSTHVYPSGAR